MHGELSTEPRLIAVVRIASRAGLNRWERQTRSSNSHSRTQGALRRVSVFSNKSTNQIVLSIHGSELQLAAQDVDFSFEGNERMKCQYTGEDMSIAFNARFLIEMLNATASDEIRIELSTPTKAGIIKPVEQDKAEDLLMLVMPLMLNS